MKRLAVIARSLRDAVKRVDPALIGMMGLGLALRLLFIGRDSLWLDEINTLIVAAARGYPAHAPDVPQTAQWFFDRHLAWQPMDVGALMAMLRQNVHAPLYYLLVNPWLGLFGLSEIALRSFSALFSTLLIAPAYGLGAALAPPDARRRAARWAALLAAVSPFHLAFAQEGRMYALALFESALAALALWKTLYSPAFRRWAVIFAMAAAAGCLTHYSFWFQAPFYLSAAVFWLWWGPEGADDAQARARKRWLLGAGAALAATMALWLPMALAQRTGVASEGDHFSLGGVSLMRMVGMLLWEPLTTLGGETVAGRALYTVILTMGATWALVAWRRGRISAHQALFLGAGVLAPLLAQGAVDWMSQTHTLTIIRYAMLIGPMTIALTACGLATSPSWQGRPRLQGRPALALAGVLTVVGVLSVWPGSGLRYREKFPARGIMAQLAGEIAPGDLLAVNGSLATPCEAAYYLVRYRPHTPIYYWARGGIFPKTPSPPVAGQFTPWSRAWLFFYRSRQAYGSYVLRDALRQAFVHENAGMGYRGKLRLYHAPRAYQVASSRAR